MRNLIVIVCAGFFLISCKKDQRYYEQMVTIEDAEWQRSNVPEIQFEIKDTSKEYHLIYTIRNGVNYAYYNLYLESELIDTAGLVLESFQKEVHLFDASTGKPFGTGNGWFSSSLGDLFDGRYLCKSYYKFPYSGNYKFTIKQYMRDEEVLEEIYAIGLRIEESNKP